MGWGKSHKPRIHYSFQQLAANTRALLDSLGVDRVSVIGHSMGGMLATRFALLYPERVEKLVLENPIGLEDYRTFVPYMPVDSLYAEERRATEASYRKYQQSYYPVWKPEYEPLVQAQAAALREADFPRTAWANAFTSAMIYEQPVCYEFGLLRCPTMLVIGQEDRTIVGKARIPTSEQALHGQYPVLGKRTQALIPGAQLVELPGVGHIPHVQEPETFGKTVLGFLTTP
jgi:pimeloyl-ACP methyl ester carboxylesterase